MSKSSTLPKYKRVLIVVGVIIGVIGLIIGALCVNVAVFRKNYYTEIPEYVQPLNPTGTQPLRAVGRGIYDKNGHRVALNGIGFGNSSYIALVPSSKRTVPLQVLTKMALSKVIWKHSKTKL